MSLNVRGYARCSVCCAYRRLAVLAVALAVTCQWRSPIAVRPLSAIAVATREQHRRVARPFDAATRGLEPDLTLPDLVIPGRPEKPPPEQPEFVQTPAQYLREADVRPARRARASNSPRNIATRWRASRSEFGVPGNVVLAIWARETDYGALQAAARRASACWRRRPISASARTSSATNSCTR